MQSADSIYRTAPNTIPAADTFGAVWIFTDINVHLTGRFTFSTVDTAFSIDLVAVQRNWIKNTVNRAQRADIFAEWTIKCNRQEN